MGVARPPKPPKERSQAALARRAEKRGRTLEEQRSLDRSMIDAVAQERGAGKKTSPAAAARPARAPPGRSPPPPPPPPRDEFAPPAALPTEKPLEDLVREADGRGMLGHRLEVMGKGAAKVISARAAKDGGGLSVKLYFDSPVDVADGPPRRTLQQTITSADVDACRFRLVAGSRADWHCAGCNFRNFGSRSACNSCHRRRFGVAPVAPPAWAPPVRKPAAKKTNVDPKRAWEGSVVAPEQVQNNKRLRDELAKDPRAMSAADRERAEQLVARDERKRGKKVARAERVAAGLAQPGWRMRKPAE